MDAANARSRFPACSGGLDLVCDTRCTGCRRSRYIRYRKTADSIVLEAKRIGTGDCWIEFSPAFSLRTQIVGAEMNGRPLAFRMQPNSNDQHLLVRFRLYGGPNNLVIHVKNDFGLSLESDLPPLGSTTRGSGAVADPKMHRRSSP